MTHLYKCTEWQGSSGLWYCNDIEDLGNGSGRWWIPARMLGLSLDKYVEMLIKDFKVDNIKYNEERDVLIFSWRKQADMRKYKNWINAAARKANFYI